MAKHVDSRAGSSLLPLAALALLAAAALVTAFGAAGSGQEVAVTLDRPDPFTPAFGQVEVAAVVASELPIERVAFYVDGVVMGELREPPYTLTIDVGESSGPHTFQAVAYAVGGATGSTSLTTPGMRVDEEVAVNLQQLYVTVSRGGVRVQDLDLGDFAVEDEGRRQKVVTFARGDVPFTAVVLLDSSQSMAGEKLTAALAGARTFFQGMRTLDEGRLIVFSDRILHSTPFTSFPEVLAAGLGRVAARGGTALNDHLYLALKQLEVRQGRRVVILLSDGVDSHSVLEMQEVLARARSSQALVYWLRLPVGGSNVDLPTLRSAWRSTEEYKREFQLLQQTIAESGGSVRPINAPREIAGAFQGIADELRDQYVLGYYPSNLRKDGRWRRVEVGVSDSGLEIRARDGYVDL